jgi:hypothetical protein
MERKKECDTGAFSLRRIFFQFTKHFGVAGQGFPGNSVPGQPCHCRGLNKLVLTALARLCRKHVAIHAACHPSMPDQCVAQPFSVSLAMADEVVVPGLPLVWQGLVQCILLRAQAGVLYARGFLFLCPSTTAQLLSWG